MEELINKIIQKSKHEKNDTKFISWLDGDKIKWEFSIMNEKQGGEFPVEGESLPEIKLKFSAPDIRGDVLRLGSESRILAKEKTTPPQPSKPQLPLAEVTQPTPKEGKEKFPQVNTGQSYEEELEKYVNNGYAEYVEDGSIQQPNANFKINQFTEFYDLLMNNAPQGYIPWFFPVKSDGKDPDPQAILKINPSSKGSWHHESARLSKEQCIKRIRSGGNIGLSAREGDALVLGDIDALEYLNQAPKTLTATSRKRDGLHFFGWDKDGTAKINQPTDFGEMRSKNQYVVACGSYVPVGKKDLDKLSRSAKEDKLLGYYTLREKVQPQLLTFADLPEFFRKKKAVDDVSDSEVLQREEKKSYVDKGGKYSELLKLKMSDIVTNAGSNKRTGHPLHESTTDANFSLSKDGDLCHCWRHMVSLNPVQYLCVQAGYSNCLDAGTPHNSKSEGFEGRKYSKLKGDKKALEIAYKEAVKMGLVGNKKVPGVDIITEQEKFLNPPEKIKQILQNPNLFNLITEQEFDKKIVGEVETRKVIFLCGAGGRLVKNCQIASYNILVNDDAGVGKDYVTAKVLEILPKSVFIHKTRISPTVFTYWHNSEYEPNWTWDGIVFYPEDISEVVLNSDVFKVMCSSGSSATIVIRQRAVDLHIEGKPVMITTTATATPSPELTRRFVILNLDSSENQTKAIMKRHCEFAKTGIIPQYDNDYTSAMEFLKRVEVQIPFADLLGNVLPSKSIIMRTHLPRFLDYIKASCGFHQYQRTQRDGYFLAEGQDYDIARECFLKLCSNKFMIPLTINQKKMLDVFAKNQNRTYSVTQFHAENNIMSIPALQTNFGILSKYGILETSIDKDSYGRDLEVYQISKSYNPNEQLEIPKYADLLNYLKQPNYVKQLKQVKHGGDVKDIKDVKAIKCKNNAPFLKQSCTFCGSDCKITETELSKHMNEKLNHCTNPKCLAVMNHIKNSEPEKWMK